jgi:predicted DNA-binding ribbon-helix-helix protein
MPRDLLSRSSLVPRNIVVRGRRTSVRLEPAMWNALAEIIAREGVSAAELMTAVERSRAASSLTAAIRVYVMDYFRVAATERGHRRAGHGRIRARDRTPASAS